MRPPFSTPLARAAWLFGKLSACALIGAFGVVALPGCGTKDSDPPPDACPGVTAAACPDTLPSYKDDVAPLLDARCNVCHSPNNAAGLWPLSNQEAVNEWSETILRQIRNCSQPPPDSAVTLSLSERKTLEAWLVCGAPDN